MSASFPCPQCSSENVISSKKRGADFCEDCGYTFPPHEPTEEVVVPLRIFLSYGHDKNEKLVRRIKADLERRGHVVWFDQTPEAGKGISSGDDWRRSITEGIKDSGCVVSFLSEHSVRDPGVCRDEIAIAIGVKGGNVKTILVEGKDLEGEGKDLEIPVSVSHIQYHDMHLWDHGTDDVGIVSAGKDGAAEGNAKWESWYKEHWDQIRKVVESKESQQFAGEIEELKGHLKPITCAARVCHLVEKGFDGRHWLLERVEKWRTGNTDKSRLLWITGKPGFGKSAFAAHLVHNKSDVVIAAHFVEWNKRDHRDARNVIRSLAFQLATRLPDYRTLLLDLPEIATLDAKDSDELFDYLIANNLRHAIKGGRERYLVVIDGLDEAGVSGRNELVNVLARQAKHLPEWISFVVTSRPESHVTAPLQGLIPQRMDTETKENLGDLKFYLDRKLGKQLAARPDRDQVVKDILDKSEGVFLYAEHFCEEVIAGHFSLDQRERFPQGLGGIYYQWFKRQFPEDYDEIRPLLGAILAARDPIPVEIIESLFKWTEPQLEKKLRRLGSLFLVTEENGHRTIKPYHKSLADWLTDRDNADDYLVSLKEGHDTLATFGLTEFKKGVAPDAYFIRHLIPHLLGAKQLNEAKELLFDLRWLEAKVAAGFAFNVPTDFDQVLEGYGPLEEGVATPLRLIGEAIRLDIHFIVNSIDYPQALMQSVTNYLRSVTTPSGDDSRGAGYPQDVPAQLQELTGKWEKYTTNKGRSWIKRLCIDRERVIGGPLRWQAEDQCLQDKFISEHHSLVFSPNGEAVAIAVGHSGNRSNAPEDWTKAYAITVWSTTTGRLLSRLFPDPSKVDLSDPPTNIPRPPQVEQLFQDYFAFKTTGGAYERGYRVEKSVLVRRQAPLVRGPSLKAALEASKKAIKKEKAPECYVGEDWREALVAGDVGALCWLDERTLLAGCRGGSIFIFDVDATAQSDIVFGTNVDSEFQIHSWDNVGIKCLAKIGTDRLVVGTSFGTVELVELAEPKRRSVCYTVQPAGRAVRSFAWHDKSGLLAVGTNFGTIHIVSPRADWSCICQLSGHTDAATGLAWSASGDRLASVSWDRTLRMWDIGTQKEIWRSPEQSYDSGSLSLSWELAEDEVLTTWNESQEGGKVRVWNAATGEPVRGFGEAEPFFKSIAGSRSRKLLAVSASGKIQMYAPDVQGVHILPPNSHAGVVRKADICYPRAEVATLASDGIRVWSAESGHWLKSPQACPDWSRYGNSDHFITYSPDGNSLACVVAKRICMFEADTLDLRWTRSVEGRGVERCTFSNDSELFFTDDGGPPHPGQYEKLGSGGMLWNVQTGQSDQSGDGIRAEKYLNSRNRSGTAFEAVRPTWEGLLSKETTTGFIKLKAKDDSGYEFHYRVSRVVLWNRKLEAFGEWIVLFKGARAPSKLCIVRAANPR